MDNDVHGTEYCIGFSTAVTRAKELINRQRTTLGSHERIGVFRIFGRNAGYTAWYAAYVTSARCVIPEVRFDLDALSELLTDDRRLNPSAYAFVIASEGAIWQGGELREVGEADAYGHRHKADVGEALADELHRRTGVETVHSDLTYDLRSGDPDALDQMVAITFANVAVDLLVGRPIRSDGRGPRRQVLARAAPRAIGWRTDPRRRGHVQHRALPAPLRGKARLAAAAGAGGHRVSGGQGAFAPERRLLTIGLLGLVTAAAFEGMAVPTVLPATVSDLGGLNLYGWAFSAFWLTNIIGITLAGSDADRRGPGRALAVGVVLFAAGMVVSGLANAMPMVIVGRAIQGFGSGALGSVIYAAIARAYPASTTPRMIALTSSAWVIPGLIGPALAGWVTDSLDWRWVFLGDRAAGAGHGPGGLSAARAPRARRSAPRYRCAAIRAAPSTRCAWHSDRRCCWRR